MPTGYTYALLKKPDMSLRDFTLLCARAFGALVLMRDDPLDAAIPDEIRPDDHYKLQLSMAEARVRQLEVMSLEEAERATEEAHGFAVARHEEGRRKTLEENAILDRMLAEVEAWQPPTKEHEGLKTFMREQLASSKSEFYGDQPVTMSGEAWLAVARQEAARNVAYYRKSWGEEVARCRERTAWLRVLKASLPAG